MAELYRKGLFTYPRKAPRPPATGSGQAAAASTTQPPIQDRYNPSPYDLPITPRPVPSYSSVLNTPLVTRGINSAADVKTSLYRPLDFDTFEIRLLRVHGFDGLGYITWSLEYASLINPPEYTALSYCWGDAGKTKTINIKHWGTVQISSNLDDALWHLCYMEESDPFRHGKGIIVWVDALCINQEDAVERSQQVRQMRQIYSRAKEVISWVPCQESEAVAYLIKNQFHRDNYETTGQVQKAQPPRASYNVHLEFEECEDKRKVWMKRGWKILDKFFRQAYWRRVWVIQEVAVAAKAKVLCGRYEITWEDIDAIIATWQKTPGSVPVNTRAYLKAVHLVEFRDRFQVKREPISLLDAMRWTYQTEATDPRDKIFALLGLCHDGATYVPVPNYKQPLEEIIADMSKAMMSFDRSLDLMCFKGTSLSEEGKLPSWTPNWVNLWSGSLHSMTLHEARYADWHTTFPFNPILYGSTPQILKVDGKFYGTIRHLTSELAQPGPDGKLTLTIEPRAQSIPSTSLLSIDSRHSNPEPIDITIRDSIWKTMTMNLLPPEFHDNTAAWCFAKLWTPEGRGAVQNLALIAWLDRNARFVLKTSRRKSESLPCLAQIGRPLKKRPPPPLMVSESGRAREKTAFGTFRDEFSTPIHNPAQNQLSNSIKRREKPLFTTLMSSLRH